MEQEDIQEQNNKFLQPGQDEHGTVYRDINDMWEKEIENKNNKNVQKPIGGLQNWYGKAAQYWENVESTVNGVLGGFDQLNEPDVKHSNKFLQELKQKLQYNNTRAIDMGAGIGRITKELLTKHFQTVDIVDQCKKYVDEAKNNYLKGFNIGHFIAQGLQEVDMPEKYDCIWVQWVSHHLTDTDFVTFLNKCKNSLNPNGFIVIKENHTKSGFLVDKEDYSVTRCEALYKEIFDKAGLQVVHESVQTDFPKELFMVKAYALIPK
ncbi:hypothetical protein PPERSA_09449 [Pseudocohnilembus persalinus]|uniref:Alpha N-terminal protein methyltransferase 1 n=1 Tax=Pseudocohnilembus persalinus TaxID=266149 RepID=A0A0V0Q9L6_PSEPJ|nr:hypothetical protein PPERSA_09449 [Pseudocohnilembus persalinus]|eukprot:KRW98924.1 hypothetical protein PPERSA_09449 [Pseudocohnilembus persalinus]